MTESKPANLQEMNKVDASLDVPTEVTDLESNLTSLFGLSEALCTKGDNQEMLEAFLTVRRRLAQLVKTNARTILLHKDVLKDRGFFNKLNLVISDAGAALERLKNEMSDHRKFVQQCTAKQ